MPFQVFAKIDRLPLSLPDLQVDCVTQLFDYPFAVQDGDSMAVFATPQHYADALAFLADALRDAGVTAIVPRVVAAELPRAGRFRVWVDWDYVFGAHTEMAASRSIYYCRRVMQGVTDATRIEMKQCSAFQPGGLAL